MFEQWMNWLKNLFREEAEEKKDYRPYTFNQSQQKQDIKAKMTYLYPEKRSLHPIVIPERSTKKRSEENTSSVRKHQRSRSKPIKLNKENGSENRKVYKKGDKPFEPTEVPSPIYGFQKRNKYDALEGIPAYERRQQKKEEQADEKETEKTAITQQTLHKQIDAQTDQVAATTEINDHDSYVNPAEPRDINPESRTNPIQSRDISSESHMSVSKSLGAKSKTHTEHESHRIQSKSDNQQAQVTRRDKKDGMDNQQEYSEKPAIVWRESKKVSMPYHLLNDSLPNNNTDDQLWIDEQQELLEETLKHFNVRAKVVKATKGPSVTRFEVQPELGVKVSKIKNLSDDLKLNMAAKDIRIEAPIPGKNTVGIEIPNLQPQMVGLQGVFETKAFKESRSPLSIALGVSIEGIPKITTIKKMPHGLIAGATGSGKSVCINTILISLIYKASHEEVKFLLIDPKMVELAPYNGIPHLVSPVITDVKAANQALKWAVNEMEERYEKFVQEGVRDVERFNQKMEKQNLFDEKMPYIVIVIDELADLMMVSPQDVEDSISRIAQKARACGIHLIVATQRPSVDVITGLIKANIPTRIAFSVSSQVDSRTIIDTSGAEKLLGRGDMLFMENGVRRTVRLQGPFVSDEEIDRVTSHARSIAEPNYVFEQEQLLEQLTVDEDEDELLQEAIEFVIRQNSASTSLLQRHFKIGYNRAARLMDSLEEKRIISGQTGSNKPREVLVTEAQLDEG